MFSGVEGSFLSHNLFAYCLNNPVNLSDSGGNLPTWAKKLAVAAAVVVTVAAVAAVTVATCGTGTALACAAMGAAKGAAIGFVTGAVSGAATGAVTHIATTGSTVGIGDAMLNGMADGALTGAITGAVTGALTSPYCFVAGTAVLAAAGAVAIETIQAGDMVWAWDEETGEVALKEVVETYVNETYELVHVFVNGEEIVTTPGHPFYSPVKGWTDAVNLRAGDVLVLVNGEYVVVEKIQHEILEAPVTVYNFQVEDYHTYYVANAGVLVHNVCKGNWADGGRGSGYNNARHHFEKHGTEVGARTLEEYTKKATNFANTVLSKKVKKAYISGYTENTYRYYFNKKYIDLAFDGVEHLIVSFGLK